MNPYRHSIVANQVTDRLTGVDLNPEVYERRVLVTGTSMISEATAKALGESSEDANRDGELWSVLSYAHWSCYGWIIAVPQEHAVIKAVYPELHALMQFAADRGFSYLQLDCDGDALPEEAGLPTFNW
jgi:hypothetical protein